MISLEYNGVKRQKIRKNGYVSIFKELAQRWTTCNWHIKGEYNARVGSKDRGFQATLRRGDTTTQWKT